MDKTTPEWGGDEENVPESGEKGDWVWGGGGEGGPVGEGGIGKEG